MNESRPQYFFYAIAFMVFAGLLLLVEISTTRSALEASFAAPMMRSQRHARATHNPTDISGPALSNIEGHSPELVEGWKTYRNEEYGFEIGYPKDFSVAGGGEGGCPKPKCALFLSKRNQISPEASIETSLQVIFVPWPLKYIEAFKQEMASLAGNIIVDTVEAIGVIRVDKGDGYRESIQLVHMSDFVEITKLWVGNGNINDIIKIGRKEENKLLLDQILSTFKFTQQ